jgi:hypothetical protein
VLGYLARFRANLLNDPQADDEYRLHRNRQLDELQSIFSVYVDNILRSLLTATAIMDVFILPDLVSTSYEAIGVIAELFNNIHNETIAQVR